MNLSIKYEYPLPRIKVDTDRINIKLPLGGSSKGKLNVKNLSKGVLSAKVSSNIIGLEFYPNIWSENSCDIMYIFDSSDYKMSQYLQGDAVIESDGGEALIAVSIEIFDKQVAVDSMAVKSLQDFVKLSQKDYYKAKDIFFSEEFLQICNIEDTHIINIYNRLKLEVYKEVALDSFLIVTEHKQYAKAIATRPQIDLAIKYYEDKKIKYKIPLKLSGYGTIELHIAARYNVPWLDIQTTTLSSMNVAQEPIIDVVVIIDTKLIADKKVSAIIDITNDYFSDSVSLTVKREELFKVELSKKSYHMLDKGNVIFTNHSGEDLVIEIMASDEWLQFKSKKYFIAGYAQIPFEINLSKMFSLIAIPVYTTKITVKTVIKGRVVKKHIEVKITDNKLSKLYEK